MIAVIFEVLPAKGKKEEYLNVASQLKTQLQDIDGFISIERFSSLSEEGKILSLSFWRDEKAVTEWRNLESHRIAQSQGRNGIFANYRLRVGEINRDYGINDREESPNDSRMIHDNN